MKNLPFFLLLMISGFIFAAPPLVDFVSQTPSDVTALNIFASNVTIVYNITDGGDGINESTAYLFYKTNSSTSNNAYYINGTAYAGYFSILTTNATDLFSTYLLDNKVYPATYPYNESIMETAGKANFSLSSSNHYSSSEIKNITMKNYSILELDIRPNPGSSSARIYYCNSSYTTGNPEVSSNCVNFFNILSTATKNHTHTASSSHYIIPMPINSTGYLVNVKVTSTSRILVRGPVSGMWNNSYISNIAYTTESQTTTNNGATWSNLPGTFDAHIHQYDDTDTFYYYLTVNDLLGNSNTSAVRNDLLQMGRLYPTAPILTVPSMPSYYYNSSMLITYLASISPNAYPIWYNISLLNANESFNQTIQSNNSNNLTYNWSTVSMPLGVTFIVGVEACDSLGQCTNGTSEPFSFSNCSDSDGDGFGVCPACGVISSCSFDGNDCNDANAAIFPPADGKQIIVNSQLCAGIYSINDTGIDGILKMYTPGVSLNCNNAVINGNSLGSFIVSENTTNIGIDHCTINGYSNGILLRNASNAHIFLNSINATSFGINIGNFSTSGNIEQNNFYSNGTLGYVAMGFDSNQSGDSIFVHNNVFANGGEGIFLKACNNHRIYNNTFQPLGFVMQNGIFLNSTKSCTGLNISSNTFNNINGSMIIIKKANITDPSVMLNSLFGYNNYFGVKNDTTVPYVSDEGFATWYTAKVLGTNIIGGPYISGNYWNNYEYVDSSGDGLGDVPYQVSSFGKKQYPKGSAENQWINMSGNIWYLELDSDYKDISASLNNATPYGNISIQADSMIGNGSAYCNGFNNYAISGSTILTPYNLTMSAWIRPSSAQYQVSYPLTLRGWKAGFTYTQFNKALAHIYTRTGVIVSTARADIPNDKWTMITMTYSNTTLNLSLYINGVLFDSVYVPDGISSTTGQYLYLCGFNTTTTNYSYHGSIDSVIVLNRTWNDSMVAQAYLGQKGQYDENPLARPALTINVTTPEESVYITNATLFQAITNKNATCGFSLDNLEGFDSIVSYWKFEETKKASYDYVVYDVIDGNNLRIIGKPYVEAGVSDGISTYALKFNSTVDEITFATVPMNANLQPNESITISVWAKASKIVNGTGTNNPIVRSYPWSVGGYGIGFKNSTSLFGYIAPHGVSQPYNPYYSLAYGWHMYTVSYDFVGSRYYFYVDNISIANNSALVPGTAAAYVPGTTREFMVAADLMPLYNFTSNMFNGTIDNVIIFSDTLNASEINTIYNYQLQIMNDTNITHHVYNVTYLSEGSHDVMFYCRADNPSQEYVWSDIIHFGKDTVPPMISLDYPADGQALFNTNVQFNYTPTNANISTCQLWSDISGTWGMTAEDTTITTNATNTFNQVVSDGSYIWSVWCNESSGISDFSAQGNLTFSVDTTAPFVNITYPMNGSFNLTFTYLNYSYTEPNPDICWYTTTGWLSNTSIGCGTEITGLMSSNSTENVWGVCMQDQGGLIGCSEVRFNATGSTTCTEPLSGLVINSSTTICSGTYYMTTFDTTNDIFLNNDDIDVVCNNTIIIGDGNGPAMHTNRTNVTVTGCTFKEYQYPIMITGNSTVILSNNFIRTDSLPCSIYLNGANGSYLLGNNLSGCYILNLISNNGYIAYNNVTNADYGVYVSSSSNTYVINNYLASNTINAWDDGTNYWNTTILPGPNIIGGPNISGNYYSDYTGSNRGDGFGNVPYTINGLGGAIDYLPLTFGVTILNVTLNYTNMSAYTTYTTSGNTIITTDAGQFVIHYKSGTNAIYDQQLAVVASFLANILPYSAAVGVIMLLGFVYYYLHNQR